MNDFGARKSLPEGGAAAHRSTLQRQPNHPMFEQERIHIDMKSTLNQFMKRKPLILAVALLTFIPTLLFVLFSTPLYRSKALIQIGIGSTRTLPYRDAADSSDAVSGMESFLRTQEQILGSTALYERVKKRLKAGSYTMKTEGVISRNKLSIRKLPDSQLFEISYLAPSPALAARTVNVLVEEYIKRDSEARQEVRDKERQTLRRELEAMEKQIQLSEQELVQYAQQHMIDTLDKGQSDPIQQKLAMFDQLVVGADAELASARANLNGIEKIVQQQLPEKFITPVIQTLTIRLLELEHALAALRVTYGKDWPAVVQKQSEIETIREQLKQEKAAALAQSVRQAQLELRTVENRYEVLTALRAEQAASLERVQKASIRYNALRRETETNRKLYEALLERFKQSGVIAGFSFGNVQVIEPGQVDSRQASPNVLWNLTLGAFLSLALGICAAIFAEFCNNSPATMTEAEQLLALPGLGTVPLIKRSSAPHLFRKKNDRLARLPIPDRQLLPSPGSPNGDGRIARELREQIRNICASILLSRSERAPKVIVFTSAVPGEGKTTLISHVGMALAENGLKTLLVEADLRKPDLSKLFGIGSEAGLSLYLSGHVNPMPQINPTSNPNLFVVAAGPTAPNPMALLNSERMQSFLRESAASFTFVLLDGPPLLAFADPRILCSRADGAVLVVKAGSTTNKALHRAKALLESSGTEIFGMILNGAELDDSGSSYYSYYEDASHRTTITLPPQSS